MPAKIKPEKAARYEPATETAKHFGVSRKTLGKWLKDKTLGFPQGIVINGHIYIDISQREAWEAAQVERSTVAA